MDLPTEVICPITRDLMQSPVIAADGFTYDQRAIQLWIKRKDISPMLGLKLNTKRIIENKTMSYYLMALEGLKVQRTKHLIKEEYKDEVIENSLKKQLEEVIDEYYMATKDLKDCCAKIEKLYKLAPNNFDIVLNCANIMRFAMDYKKVFELFKELKKLKPNNLAWRFLKVKTLADMNNKEQAAKVLEQVLSQYKIIDYTLVELRYLSLAQFSVSANLRKSSENYIKGYLRLIQNDARALSHYVNIELQNENYKEVKEVAEKCLKMKVRDISILVYLATACIELHDIPYAKSIYHRLIEETNDVTIKARSLYSLGTLGNQETEAKQIIEEMEESYRLDPNEDADVYLTSFYLTKGMHTKAEEWLEKCSKRIDINSDTTLLFIKAQIQESKKNFEGAVENYIRLTEIDEANIEYYSSKIEMLLDAIKGEAESAESDES